jgi:hypothetical protein
MNYKSFTIQNPWRSGKLQKDTSFPRAIFNALLQSLDNKDILILTGSRQVGKTTLLKSMITKLLEQKTRPDSIFYFNLDDDSLHPYFEQYTDFISFINSEYKGFCYVFIDEIQRLKNPGIFLKLIHDLDMNLKIVVSGSSSLELKSKTTEHLTGRKRVFELFPFSFSEYLSSRQNDFYLKKELPDLIKYHHDDLNLQLFNFIIHGGYPKVLFAETDDEKEIELKEIYDSYIKKDVKDFLNIDNINGYNNLVKAFAYQVGNLINYNEISNISGLNIKTVMKYIDYLEGTYIFKRVPPWFQSSRKEISKAPKIFGFDTGLINYITSHLNKELPDKGSIFENFVFSELTKHDLDIKFWRTGSGAEVDFIVNDIPIEIKSGILKKDSLTKSFSNFCKKYEPEKGFVFSNGFSGQRRFEKTTIYFFPLWAIPKVIFHFRGRSI